jgi:hypothetical protein
VPRTFIGVTSVLNLHNIAKDTTMVRQLVQVLVLGWIFVMQSLDGAVAIRSLRVLSPLRALTIWDPEIKDEPPTARSRFLPVFRARLEAETEARKELKQKKDQELQASATSGWAGSAARSDRRRRKLEESLVEAASDQAAAKAMETLIASAVAAKKTTKNDNQYQFVGVVNAKASGPPIKWYARKKPAGSKWSVRLVHVDKAAIITDLFRRGEVDIVAKYKNTGTINPETNIPVIESEYSVRERSFR